MQNLGLIGEALRSKIKDASRRLSKDEIEFLNNQGIVARGTGFADIKTGKFVSNATIDGLIAAFRGQHATAERETKQTVVAAAQAQGKDPVYEVVSSINESIEKLFGVITEKPAVPAPPPPADDATAVGEEEESGIMTIFKGFMKFVRTFLTSKILWLTTLAMPLLDLVKSGFVILRDMIDGLQKVFTDSVLPFFKETIPAWFDEIKLFFVETIPKYFEKFMVEAKSAVSALLDFPKKVLLFVQDYALSFGKSIIDQFSPWLEKVGIDTKSASEEIKKKQEQLAKEQDTFDKKKIAEEEARKKQQAEIDKKYAELEKQRKEEEARKAAAEKAAEDRRKAEQQKPAVPAPAAPKPAEQKAAPVAPAPAPRPVEQRPVPVAPAPVPQPPAEKKPAVPEKEEPKKKRGTVEIIYDTLVQYGITSLKAISNVLAQVKAESGFVPKDENLKYSSAERIMQVFGKRRIPSLDFAKQFVNKPAELANYVYAKTDGNSEPGDGFKYRGRGFIQHTGKNQYKAIKEFTGEDVVNRPELLNTVEVAAKAIPWFFLKYKRKSPESLESITAVNKAIGFAGGAEEAKHRELSAEKIYSSLGSMSGKQVEDATKAADVKPPKPKRQSAPIPSKGNGAPNQGPTQNKSMDSAPNPTAVAEAYRSYWGV